MYFDILVILSNLDGYVTLSFFIPLCSAFNLRLPLFTWVVDIFGHEMHNPRSNKLRKITRNSNLINTFEALSEKRWFLDSTGLIFCHERPFVKSLKTHFTSAVLFAQQKASVLKDFNISFICTKR